ncbi:KEOPS complex subunit Cgi121 [Halorubrum gandharaense]
MSDPAETAAASEETRPTTPEPDLRLVEGVAEIDDLDAFLAEIRAITEVTGAVVQAFDAEIVVSDTHLTRATELAARAVARGDAVARDPAVEVLLYAAGRRQIDRALTMGVDEGTTPVVVVVTDFGEVPNATRDGDPLEGADLDAAVEQVRNRLRPADTLGQYDESRVREFFDVTDRELAATDGNLADIVCERVALLNVEK